MGEIPLIPDTCARCSAAPSKLGSMFCEACDQALKNPIPPPPVVRTVPRRCGPRMTTKPVRNT